MELEIYDRCNQRTAIGFPNEVRTGVLPADRRDGISDDIRVFNAKLRESEDYYNRPSM